MSNAPGIVMMGAISVVIALLVLVWSWLPGQRGAPAEYATAPSTGPNPRPGDNLIGLALGFVGRLGRRLTPGARVQRLERRVVLAASPAWNLERALAAKIVLGAAGFMTGWIVVGIAGPTSALLTVALGLLGYVTPNVLLHGRAVDRAEEIRIALPDTLDQLTISVEAGLGFDAALQRVAETGEGALADELGRTLRDMTIGTPRAVALRSLSERAEVPELRQFVVAMLQAEQFGLPIARVLRVQSADLRVRRRQTAEERAMKIPVKIVFPLITCIFPALFVILLGPAFIRILRALG